MLRFFLVHHVRKGEKKKAKNKANYRLRTRIHKQHQ